MPTRMSAAPGPRPHCTCTALAAGLKACPVQPTHDQLGHLSTALIRLAGATAANKGIVLPATHTRRRRYYTARKIAGSPRWQANGPKRLSAAAAYSPPPCCCTASTLSLREAHSACSTSGGGGGTTGCTSFHPAGGGRQCLRGRYPDRRRRRPATR